MRCLILGGAGFIGSHVVERLAGCGHRLRLLDLRPNPHAAPPAGVECLWADWNDGGALDHALSGMEAVVHLIGATWPGHDDQEAAHGETAAAFRMLEGCVARGVRRVVFLSSGGTVYGIPRRTPIDEEHPQQPICAYGIAKLAVERQLRLFHRSRGLEYVILRGANVYGERHDLARPQGAVNVFLRHMARGEPIEIWGDGEAVRDYLHVSDLAEAFRLALAAPLGAGVFNVGSGKGVSLNGLIAACRAETGLDPRVHYLPERACDVPVNILAIDKIRSELGWSPRVGLAEGIARTWRWTRSSAPGPVPEG